jgi:hypothetical protein
MATLTTPKRGPASLNGRSLSRPGGAERLGGELQADVAAGGPEPPAQADLAAALQHGDDHDVGDAKPADQQGPGRVQGTAGADGE